MLGLSHSNLFVDITPLLQTVRASSICKAAAVRQYHDRKLATQIGKFERLFWKTIASKCSLPPKSVGHIRFQMGNFDINERKYR